MCCHVGSNPTPVEQGEFSNMRNMIRFATLLATASALVAPAAMAQVRDLDSAVSDVRVFQGTVAGEPAVFTVTAPAQGSLQIDVIATGGMDPVVRVYEGRGNNLLAEDDDGGEGLNSRVVIRDQNSRRIRIEVDSYDASWAEEGEAYGGSFDLRLSTSNCTSGATGAITYGGSATGAVCGEENLYTFRGTAGQTLEVAMIASDDELDPYLELRNAQGETVATNDDSNGTLNSRISHTFADSGTYTIVATGFGDSTGGYTLHVRGQRQVAAQLPLQVIGLADEATGEVGSSWGSEEGLALTHIDYQLSDAAKAAIMAGNGEVTIRMTANADEDPVFGSALDPMVELGFETPLGFAVVDSDDDGAGDLNSLLPVDLGAIAGSPELLDMLRIRAQGFGGSAGAYTLVINEGLEARVYEAWEAEAAVEAGTYD